MGEGVGSMYDGTELESLLGEGEGSMYDGTGSAHGLESLLGGVCRRWKAALLWFWG